VGTYGATALVLCLLARVFLLAELGDRALLGLVLAGGLSRVPPVWQLAALPYVTEKGVAKSGAVVRAGRLQAAIATIWGIAPLVACSHVGWITLSHSFALIVLLLLVGSFAAWRYRARAGGVTGDFLGATQQLGEVAVLALLSAS